MPLNSPKKAVSGTIRKIGKGHSSQKLVNSLTKTVSEHPELIKEATYQLMDVIRSGKKTRISGYALDALLNIVEIDPGPLAKNANALIDLIQTADDRLDMNNTLKAMDILSILAIDHPELMRPAIPVLFQKIHHSNSNVRSASYFILDLIAKPQPEFFLDHKPELTKCLHGLNIDERVYGVRLIDTISSDYPDVMDDLHGVLRELAYNHPSNEVRSRAYEVFKKFHKDVKDPETGLHEFEKDFIGLDNVVSDDGDFNLLADELADRIKGVDFEASAADLLKSMGMGHLIVNPEYTEEDIVEDQEPLEKLPPKPKVEEPVEVELNRIEHLVTDPIIKARMAVLRDISQPEPPKPKTSEVEPEEEEEIVDEPYERLSDISKEMSQLIISELSEQDWVINIGLITKHGKIIAAKDQGSMDDKIRKRICELLDLEESRREGFRNRISIELSDKQLIGMSIDNDYILISFTKSGVQFGMVLYELTKAAEKIEELIR